MALQPQNERPFGFRDKLGYLFGDFGNDFTFIFAGSYLTLFYTDVLGVSAGLVGVLFVVARCVDAFTDVGMGRLVDTLPRPAAAGSGRGILRVCVPVALASVLMYLYFARSWPYAGKVAYMFATYIFWGSICYTAINIPYGSMASVLSADAGERASLSTFRSVGAMLANLIIAAATPLFLFRTAADGTQTVIPERFTLIAVVYGVCAVACYLLCYALCRERVQAAPPREAKRQSFASLAKALAGNRALTAVIGAALLLLLASLLGQGMNMYLFKDYFNSADMLSLVGFAGVLPMLALAPFAAKLSKRFGKKEAGCVGVGVAAGGVPADVGAASALGVGLYRPDAGGQRGRGAFSIWSSGRSSPTLSIIRRLRTGSRDDGTVYAVYSFARKLGQALAGGVVGFALAAIGYVSSTGHVVQTQPVARGHLHHFHAGARPELSRRVPCAAAGLSAHQKARGGKRRRAARTARRSGTGAVAAPAGRTARVAYDTAFRPVFPGHILSSEKRGKNI